MTPESKKTKKTKSHSGFGTLNQFIGTKPKNGTKKSTRSKKSTIKKKSTLNKNPSQSASKKKTADIPKRKTELNKVFEKIYLPKNQNPIGDERFKFKIPRNNRESQKSWHIRLLDENNDLVKNMKEGILLSVDYDGGFNKAFAKFYDLSDNQIKIWIDSTNHRPYCLHKATQSELSQNPDLLTHEGFEGMEMVKKYDLLDDKEINVMKIYGNTPTDIGGTNGIREALGGAWEARIRYHHSYIYDQKLIPGMSYEIKEGKISLIESKTDQDLSKELMKVFDNEEKEIQTMAKDYQQIFSTNPHDLVRLAYDIEVEETSDGTLPNPMISRQKVISISFAATDGLKMVYVLERPNQEDGEYNVDFPKDAKIFFFTEERELLKETFRIFWEYPIILTFNGDNFDNLYLYHRAKKLKIKDEVNPIYVSRGGGMVTHNTDYKHSIHLDIFQFYANRSIKGYAFGGVYLKNSLEAVASSLLGEGKIKHEGTLIGNMTSANLIYYNLVDSLLTLELTTFNNNVMWNLLIVLMRITKLPFQDIFRLQISAWIRSLMFSIHRAKNCIIPRMNELETRGNFLIRESDRIEGAYVIDPIPGIHFNVAVLDFSSLYPSIIKTKNLSYDTVRCQHPECKSNKIPYIKNSWACTKKMGIFAYVIGFLRDVRVKWFKPLSNNKNITPQERQTANVMTSALKVFINGSYGVIGSSIFPLYYRPAAEATTAIARFSIHKTIEKAESMGIKVLYGDTDSVFLLHPTKEQVDNLVKWSEEKLDLDLELEKTYQFLALSKRKKNYIGVYKGGEIVDLKGLLAKKHNTPNFIKNKFAEVQKILTTITDMGSFNANRQKIINIIKKTSQLIGKPIEKGGFSIQDYGIMVALRKKIDAYDKGNPQHVRAARLLPEKEQKQLERGSFINFVKTRSNEGVKPLSMATLNDIDYTKYKEMVKSTFEQILDALNIEYDEVLGIKKLSSFF